MQSEPAGLKLRAVAFILDYLILTLINFPVYLVAKMLGDTPRMSAYTMFSAVGAVVQAVYYILFLATPAQATPGKWLMKIRVVRAEDGRGISAPRAAGRYVVLYLFSLLIYPLAAINPNIHAFAPVVEEVPMQPSDKIPTFAQTMENQKQEEAQMAAVRQKQAAGQALTDAEQALVKKKEREAAFRVIHEKMIDKKPLTAEEQAMVDGMKRRFELEQWIPAMPGPRGYYNLVFIAYMLTIIGMIAFTREKIGLHDYVCNTRVVKGRAESAAAPESAG